MQENMKYLRSFNVNNTAHGDLVSLDTAPLKVFSLIERIRKAPPAVYPLYLYKHKQGQNVCWI